MSCMFLLESLKEIDWNQLKPLIQEFLINDHKEDGRWDSVRIIAKILLMVLEVPQYTNGNDCGNDIVHIDFTLSYVFPKQEVKKECFPSKEMI